MTNAADLRTTEPRASGKPEPLGTDETRQRLLPLVQSLAYEEREQEFVLTSGGRSRHYIDGKQVTLSAEGLCLFAQLVLRRAISIGATAVGGPTLGADPIVGGVITLSHLGHVPLRGFIVRKEAKAHGTQALIEGPELTAADRVVIVEDVLTTGRSVLQAIEAVKATGCTIAGVVVLVDREEGGVERLRAEGYRVDPIFTLTEVRQAPRTE